MFTILRRFWIYFGENGIEVIIIKTGFLWIRVSRGIVTIHNR